MEEWMDGCAYSVSPLITLRDAFPLRESDLEIRKLALQDFRIEASGGSRRSGRVKISQEKCQRSLVSLAHTKYRGQAGSLVFKQR